MTLDQIATILHKSMSDPYLTDQERMDLLDHIPPDDYRFCLHYMIGHHRGYIEGLAEVEK